MPGGAIVAPITQHLAKKQSGLRPMQDAVAERRI
jgi:hypothetical protein